MRLVIHGTEMIRRISTTVSMCTTLSTDPGRPQQSRSGRKVKCPNTKSVCEQSTTQASQVKHLRQLDHSSSEREETRLSKSLSSLRALQLRRRRVDRAHREAPDYGAIEKRYGPDGVGGRTGRVVHRGEGHRSSGCAGLVRLGDAGERGRRGFVLECGLLGVTVRQGDREFGLSGLVRMRL